MDAEARATQEQLPRRAVYSRTASWGDDKKDEKKRKKKKKRTPINILTDKSGCSFLLRIQALGRMTFSSVIPTFCDNLLRGNDWGVDIFDHSDCALSFLNIYPERPCIPRTSGITGEGRFFRSI